MPDLSGPKAQELADKVVLREEGLRFETKRVSRSMVSKALETICAFANTEGGILALGVEDLDKVKGHARLFGIGENPEAVDELRRKVVSHLVPTVEDVQFIAVACRLRDGSAGEIVLVNVPQSGKVHSILDDGTFVRLPKSNRELTAHEINELSFARGVISIERETVEVPFRLLDTATWQLYVQTRGLTSGPAEALMERIGLARETPSAVRPTRAAVLLFADDPGALMGCKAAIRIFHYSGTRIEHGPVPNLKKTPKTITGPLIEQIARADEYVRNEIASGLTLAASGFETVHHYPTRVIKEAITNAVIHRDYRLNNDIHIRIFDNRIEVESPGEFPGRVTAANIERAGSFSRNSLIVNHLREFPNPPNIDAGEGVRMMFSTMRAVGLYPPLYVATTSHQNGAVIVTLRNEERPPIWEQVSAWMDRNGAISNSELCRIAGVDTLRASKMLRMWVEQGLLVADTSKGKRLTTYAKPGLAAQPEFELPLSPAADNGSPLDD